MWYNRKNRYPYFNPLLSQWNFHRSDPFDRWIAVTSRVKMMISDDRSTSFTTDSESTHIEKHVNPRRSDWRIDRSAAYTTNQTRSTQPQHTTCCHPVKFRQTTTSKVMEPDDDPCSAKHRDAHFRSIIPSSFFPPRKLSFVYFSFSCHSYLPIIV